MTTTSIPKAERSVRVCTGCGETAKALQAARSAKSPEEARALPLYCPKCNPRQRNAGAMMAMLEGMGV